MTTVTEPKPAPRTLELAFASECPTAQRLRKAMFPYPGWVLTKPTESVAAEGFRWGIRVVIPTAADANWHVKRLIKALRVPDGILMGTLDSARRVEPKVTTEAPAVEVSDGK